MKKFYLKLARFSGFIVTLVRNFSRTERYIFIALACAMTISVFGILVSLYQKTTTIVPVRGGSYTEAIMGTPRFINPVLAHSTTDQDLVEIIFAGLMTYDGTRYVPELAKEYHISDDGTEYTFILRDDITFHDGKSLTADDVVFTIETIQNSVVQSPLRNEWLGISVSARDQNTVVFTLDHAYAGFLRLTTVGILPRHLWQEYVPDRMDSSPYNMKAIGAGPYTLQHINKNKVGIPERIVLKKNSDYVLGNPFIRTLSFDFFTDNQNITSKLKNHALDGFFFTSNNELNEGGFRGFENISFIQSQVFGIFFNTQTQPLFQDPTIIQALEIGLSREAIIKHVLNDAGTPVCDILPPGMTGYLPCTSLPMTQGDRIQQATRLLENHGWKRNREGILEKNGVILGFTLALPNNPELKETAAMIQTAFSELGIIVQPQIFEPGNFDQDVIRPRSYQALLFGQHYEHDTDAFAFWHSSGIVDPGLNIGMMQSSSVDTLLERTLTTFDDEQRARLFKDLAPLTPEPRALMLYSPWSIYTVDNDVHIPTSITSITQPSERFSTIHTWFIFTNRVWKLFAPVSS